MAKRLALKIEEIRDAIIKCGGMQAHAAKMLGVNRSTLANRVRKSSVLREAIEESRERMLDIAESKLIEKVNAGDLGAICFFLKCQGKQRGYIEKAQIEHSGGVKNEGPPELTIVLNKIGDN